MHEVLIVGSSGYLGSRTLRAFSHESNFSVSTLNRAKSGAPFIFKLESKGRSCEVDIRDSSLSEKLRRFEFVLSLAADVSKTQDAKAAAGLIAGNVMLPSLLGASLQGSDCRIIHTGTFSHKSDSADYDPQTFYAATKFAGETLLSYFSSHTNLRLTTLHLYDIYGPDQPHERIIPMLRRRLAEGDSITMTKGRQEIRPVFVDDIVRLLIELCTWPPAAKSLENQTYDVFGPDLLTVMELPSFVARSLDVAIAPGQVEFSMPYSGKEIMKFQPCHPLPPLSGGWTSISKGLSLI